MKKKVAVLGASVGGLIAAGELAHQGCEVQIFEKSKTVGGLFSKISTPFGLQELGMHVLYVSDRQIEILTEVFGAQSFSLLHGTHVDIGGSTNFNQNFFNSVYPNLIKKAESRDILDEILRCGNHSSLSSSALGEAQRRFGKVAAQKYISPILEGLWSQSSEDLSPGALNCFFDLRRIVICNKKAADELKSDPRLDEVIANPVQLAPKGKVFGDRKALIFDCQKQMQLNQRACDWAHSLGIGLEFGCEISLEDGLLLAGDRIVSSEYDAVIVTLPLQALGSLKFTEVDFCELSLYYFEIDGKIRDEVPAYYLMVHDPSLSSSRIVNYDGYQKKKDPDVNSVIAIEAIHPAFASPDITEISRELNLILPSLKVIDSFKLQNSLKLYSPTQKNAKAFDALENDIQQKNDLPIYFAGMRTDQGLFFSHHTIGKAHESALEISRRLS